jgi:hypothetical protein
LAEISNHLTGDFPDWVEEFVGEPLRGLPNRAATEDRPYRSKMFTEKPLKLDTLFSRYRSKGGILMCRKLFLCVVLALMTLALTNPAVAGVEPSPFKSQLNKLNSISNVLDSINKRLNHLLVPTGRSPKADPSGVADQLGSMAEQFRELRARMGDVHATFGDDPVDLPAEIRESLDIIERQTSDIADLAQLVFFKEARVMSALHELKTNIKAFAGRVAGFLNTSVKKIVPLSFILAQDTYPFQSGGAPFLNYEQLQSNLRALNESFAHRPTGVKFWIKSTEGYRMNIFANESMVCESPLRWNDVKGELKQIYSLSIPDGSEVDGDQGAGSWIRYAVNNYSDRSDLIVWLFDKESLTIRDANNCDGSSSMADFPDNRRVLMNARNMYNPVGSVFSPYHLVHELGHFFGLSHVWEPPAGTHPTTGQPLDHTDIWDMIYCLNDLGSPFFFSSKSDAQAYSGDCARNDGYRNIAKTGNERNCLVDNRGGSYPDCAGNSVMRCTVDGPLAGYSFSSGDSALKGLSFPTGDPENCPKTFAWGVNAMGYWGGTYLAHLLTPGYFSDSQRKLIRAQVSGESLTNRKELGTNSDSYIWWANGDLSFAREKKPVSTRTFIPVAGDFDGNGADDIFWYQPGTASDVMWFSNGNRTWTENSSFTANEVAVPVAGDFDGNGATDILWYVPRAPTHSIWWFSVFGTGYVKTTINMTPSVLRTYIPIVGNFDGLHGDDILWYEPVGGTTFMWLSDGSGSFSLKSFFGPGENYKPIAGDFNCDGKTDIFWYAKGPATDKVWWAASHGDFASSSSDDIQVYGTYSPIVGDFNGDGCSDILWDAVGHTTDFLWTGSELGIFGKTTATAFDAFTPIPGKFDSGTATDIFWYNKQ